MLSFDLIRTDGILIITPEEKLGKDDFMAVSREVDPFIETKGSLAGIMIVARKFPGWEDFNSFISHVKFIRDHHRKVKKVAFVAEGSVMSLLPGIGGHFVAAEVRHFPMEERDSAMAWLKER